MADKISSGMTVVELIKNKSARRLILTRLVIRRFRYILRYMINCVTSGYLTLATKWRALVNMPLE